MNCCSQGGENTPADNFFDKADIGLAKFNNPYSEYLSMIKVYYKKGNCISSINRNSTQWVEELKGMTLGIDCTI